MLLALAMLVHLVSSSPWGSPLCSVEGASSKISAGMGPNKMDLSNYFAFTASSSNLFPGNEILITISTSLRDDAAHFNGILLYATGDDQNARIGKFDTPFGTKAATSCSRYKLDDPNSVITHSLSAQVFRNLDTTYKFTVPESGFSGKITFSAIIMQAKITEKKWAVWNQALVIENGAPLQTSNLQALPTNQTSGSVQIGPWMASVAAMMIF